MAIGYIYNFGIFYRYDLSAFANGRFLKLLNLYYLQQFEIFAIGQLE